MHRISSLSCSMTFAFALAALLFAGGCAGDRVPVRGEVYLDEEPLPKGVIKFVPLQGVDGPQVAADIVDGEYEFDSGSGPVEGEHRVEIYLEQPLTPGLDDPEEFMRLGGPQGKVQEAANPVAPQFNTASTLTAKPSHESDDTFDFRVTTTSPATTP